MTGADAVLAALDGHEPPATVTMSELLAGAATPDSPLPPPIRPVGRRAGVCYLISAAGEFRDITADRLERGRGVEELFLAGTNDRVREWLKVEFPGENGTAWGAVGRWVVRQCAAAGLFNPAAAEIRGVGTWPDGHGGAVAHCGDALVAMRSSAIVPAPRGGPVWVADAPIGRPAEGAADRDDIGGLAASVRSMWGWAHPDDGALFFGWLAVAALGAVPPARPTLILTGPRGCGKSELAALAADLLGSMATVPVNDYSEAGIRQAIDRTARAVLLDEGENGEHGDRMAGVLALLRRRYSGSGGQVLRGGAAGAASRFTSTGAALLCAIVPPAMGPADASRSVTLRLGAVPQTGDPAGAARRLTDLRDEVRASGPGFWRRCLEGAGRFLAAEAAFRATALRAGADAREASTAAAVLAGWHIAAADGEIDAEALALGDAMLRRLIGAARAQDGSEGELCLDHLLGQPVRLSHGAETTLGELLAEADRDGPKAGPETLAALARRGLRLGEDFGGMLVSAGHPQLLAAYAATRWRAGGHVAALLTLPGAGREPHPIRFGSGFRGRALRLPDTFVPGRGS